MQSLARHISIDMLIDRHLAVQVIQCVPSTLCEAFAVADDVWMLPQLDEEMQICQARRKSSRLAFEGSLSIKQFGQQLALLDSILHSRRRSQKLLTVHGSHQYRASQLNCERYICAKAKKQEFGSFTANTTRSQLPLPNLLFCIDLLKDMLDYAS